MISDDTSTKGTETTPTESPAAGTGSELETPSVPPKPDARAAEGSGRQPRGRRAMVEAALVAAVAALLCALAVPAPFTIDEDNYLVTVLAARQGQLGVPGTEGLPPSRELRYFCPQAHSIEVRTTPVHSVAPPLYAYLALPFSFLGWRGLVLINALAYGLTAVLTFRHIERVSRSRSAPWIGTIAVTVGAFTIEYAQGLWPHMLAVLLVFSGYLLVEKSLDASEGRSWLLPFAGGLMAALATGVRYQNAILTLSLGLIVAFFASRRRWQKCAGYAAGAALPLTVSSLVNHLRIGSWNPISKGGNYLSVPVADSADSFQRAVEALAMLWARTVDFTARPYSTVFKTNTYITRSELTGAYFIDGSLKKALVQSSPWAALTLAVLLLAWFSRRGDRHRIRGLRRLSLCVFPVLLALSAAGANRIDGLCFNQRYLLELLPFLATALVLALEDSMVGWKSIVLGGAAVLVPMILWDPQPARSSRFLMVAPLVIAAALLGGFALWRVSSTSSALAVSSICRKVRHSALLGALLGASFGWALAVHLLDDISTSRRMRQTNQWFAEVVGPEIPDHSAIFAWYGAKDPLGVLQMDRNVVIVDPHADGGKDAGALATALLAKGRQLFVIVPGVPRQVLGEVIGRRGARVVLADEQRRPLLIEVR